MIPDDEQEFQQLAGEPTTTTGTATDHIAAASSMFPGFRFSPTDDELISYYLINKLAGSHHSVHVIPEIEIWKYEPWELPGKSVIPSETEWFFFSPRGRKYPNGSQSKRATELGYWKATGKERSVKSSSNSMPIGTKRTLVFHLGRAPKGERTEWIMHEYCVLPNPQHDSMVVCRLRKNADFRLDQPRDNINNDNSNTRSPSYDDHFSVDTEAPPMPTPTPTPQPPPPPPSSTQVNDSIDDHDDFFADILKDEIVKLDQALDFPSASSSGSTSSSSKPAQGTANRRIRLLTRTNTVTVTPTPSAPPRLLLALVLLLLTIFLPFFCFYAATVLLC